MTRREADKRLTALERRTPAKKITLTREELYAKLRIIIFGEDSHANSQN